MFLELGGGGGVCGVGVGGIVGQYGVVGPSPLQKLAHATL